ncbi:B12-binding domain-containing radical SAM protein [Litorilinea aerophila]|uniref:B12-binding domain-containing radical SAM protein n=1 Tax=Litorilinea aerophila TaxID=1204385 RepID=A0A540VD21_9CHLR|nr:radical SAM protein [Litorilinea aerophila]MCC9077524.1 B12-binding domain-containing radical SAM protein [Litorilinea aerophila]GIV79362.1 MAG: B12-binding domain-containing radical SAM protein [Litorilinea sp.]
MRRVVLIRPKRDGRIFGKAPGSPYTLMRLASLVPEEIPVEIWDENLYDLPLDTLREGDLVGISAMTTDIDRAEVIARRAMQQGAGVAIGGVHATLLPEHVQTFAHSTMVGEGYFTWQQLIQDFAAEGIKGMKPVYRDEEWANLDGIATITDRVIQMVDENKNYWTPYLEITRGCPRNCSFCTAIRVSGRRMRLRPVEEVVDEIQRRGIKRFFLTDDNFGLNFTTAPDYCAELFEALSKLDLQGWTCQSEMSIAKHPELLEMSRAAHLDKHFIGFESVNPDNRRELGGKSKGLASGAEEAIRIIRGTGVGVVGLFVMGFDEDTPATFQAMWDFIRTSELDSVSITILTPFPETPFRKQLEQENRLLDMPWKYYDTAHVTFVPKNFTVDELREAYDWLCRKTYSPWQIARRGLRSLWRYPLSQVGKKAFGSFSTDYGYRRTYAYRNT